MGHVYAKPVQIEGTTQNFTETGGGGVLCKQKSGSRQLTAEDDVERIGASFLRSPKKSKGSSAKEFSISKLRVCRILPKGLV